MSVYNAVLHFLHLHRVATAAEDKFARIADIIVCRIDEIGRISEFALFFRILPRISLSFYASLFAVYSSSSFFFPTLFQRVRARDVPFKMLHREMLKSTINKGGQKKRRLLNEKNRERNRLRIYPKISIKIKEKILRRIFRMCGGKENFYRVIETV